MELVSLKEDGEELCGEINAKSESDEVVFCQKAKGHNDLNGGSWHTAAIRVGATDGSEPMLIVDGENEPLTLYETWPDE